MDPGAAGDDVATDLLSVLSPSKLFGSIHSLSELYISVLGAGLRFFVTPEVTRSGLPPPCLFC